MITTVTLAIASGISAILIKEVFFSRLSRDSALAYYAADTALECALSADNGYVDPETGIGIFPYDSIATVDGVLNKINTDRKTNFTSGTIYCATAPIFDVSVSGFSVVDFSGGSNGIGKTSTYNMKMNLGGTTSRCAKITVNKTATYRQIISRGYSNCNIGSSNTLERAVVNETKY